MTVFPDDVTLPLASNLNFVANQVVPNLVTVRVPASGVVDFYNKFGAAHVVGDVVGYYDDLKATNAGRFVGLTPARRFDSRVSSPAPPPGKLPANNAFFLRMTNTAGLPANGIGSVVINVTVTEPTDPSFLTVTPPDSPLPLASNLNFVGGQTVPNLVIVKPTSAPVVALAIPTPGWIAIYNKFGATHVVVDVFGYFTASFTDVTGLNVDTTEPTDLYGAP